MNQGLTIPTIISELEGMQILCIAAKTDRSAVLNSDGELFTWGSAKNGSMLSSDGKAYPDNLTLPTIFGNPEFKFTQCAVGRDHMAVIY